ncbi:MAG: PAS domain-containing protein [Blastocatellia bacterium]|nr:PAS domain-containing protein [Blastocatellia bacterium]
MQTSSSDPEIRHRDLFNQIDQGFCILEVIFDEEARPIDYRFIDINPSFEEMTGISSDDARAGKSIREMVPNLEQKWVDIYASVALTGTPQRFVEGSDALGRWFSVYAFRVDEPSRLVGVLFTDITEKRRTEEELLITDERLRLALDVSQISIFELDLRTGDATVDAYGRSIYGFGAGDKLTGRMFAERFHPEDRRRIAAEFAKAQDPAGLHQLSIEHRIVLPDGEVRWIKARARVFFESEGGEIVPASCMGTYIDTTSAKLEEAERRRLTEQLEAERASLKYMFNAAPAFVAKLRGPDHVFELTNPAYLNLVRRTDVVGRTVAEALPEVVEQGFIAILDSVYSSGKPFIGREIPIDLKGSENDSIERRYVNFVYQPIFAADGSVSGIFAHGVDITEQVAARKAAEEADRAKDEFLATLSHELRTPLNAILGWAQMLGKPELDAGLRQRGVETIQRNTRLQSQLIDDVLDVSRIISGKLALKIEHVNVETVIESALEAVVPAATAKSITLHKEIDPGVNLILGDTRRLHQIVWNLLSNAMKFTPKGGEVRIGVRRVESRLALEVSDTGIGINPEVMPYVFDRFRQGNSSTTRRHGGLGLGLAIVRHLVEMHGGEVSVYSEGEGKGSTFTVLLPLVAVVAVDASRESGSGAGDGDGAAGNGPHASLAGLHVLVVDDEEDGRELIATVLELRGARVTLASSSAEALEKLGSEQPDVILSDIGMPGEDGYTLIKKIRDRPVERGGEIPAVALTAYAGAQDREMALRSGFQVHVPKPVDPKTLVDIIAGLANGAD